VIATSHKGSDSAYLLELMFTDTIIICFIGNYIYKHFPPRNHISIKFSCHRSYNVV